MAFEIETPINTDKICRTCLVEGSDMKSVFSIDESNGETFRLYEMLMSCTSVQVMEDDGLPNQICPKTLLGKFWVSPLKISEEKDCEALQPKLEYIDIKISRIESDSEIGDTNVDVQSDNTQTSMNRRKIRDDTKQKIYPCEECTQCFTTATDLKLYSMGKNELIGKSTIKGKKRVDWKKYSRCKLEFLT
ncbi:Zinc-finger associated domain (zf-AD) [Popillia japonica]|uniref:Zinc-finger associated domain (Zf-AD) n=1 Tax=Popillia japonica TaxID=7064 RepID=A0AAW1JJG9_POPJA